jgi:hypothetical protein
MARRWRVPLFAVPACAAALVACLAGPSGSAGSIAAACPPAVKPPPERLVTRPRWLEDVLVTQYFPAPEQWFDGRKVRAPGLAGLHRIDWLYSARGLAMQGEGIGADGRLYHFAGPYSLTWRNAEGRQTEPCAGVPGVWTNGSPAWIGTTRVAADGRVTYPLAGGGWSHGPPAKTEAGPEALFATGASLRLSYWHDVAVDPRLIAHGSSIFVPAYCGTPSHGWFVAADTGGAIIGRHIDMFRTPPSTPWADGLLRGARIYVVPPGFARPSSLHC